AELKRNPGAVIDTLTEVEALVGKPGDYAETRTLSTLARALEEASRPFEREVEKQLAEVALSILAEPQFRLTGVEETAQRLLPATLAGEARAQKAAAQEHLRQSTDLYRQIAPLMGNLRKSFLVSWGKGQSAAELADILHYYPRLLWQSLLHQRL